MPHRANTAIGAWLASQPMPVALSVAQAQAIVPHLLQDSEDLLYSGMLSLLQAISGASEGNFSWSIVKLYYASFYAVRSLLGSNGVALYYHNRKPKALRIAAGEIPVKAAGNSHKAVWGLLEAQFPNSPLPNLIGGDKSYDWMTILREEANYTRPKFVEPLLPACFGKLDMLGSASALQLYIDDVSMTYAFDPDHAVVSFPVECLRRASDSLLSQGRTPSEADELQMQYCADKFGLILRKPMFI